MGVVLPEKEFLEGLRKICDEEGIVLLFDEVIYRISGGLWRGPGALQNQGRSDLSGKIIGGGLPVGAYGGKGRSWRKSLLLEAFIRPGHSPEILWP